MLDSTSFVIPTMDGKYFMHKVHVCGATISAHLQFQSVADSKHAYKEIKNIVNILYKN